MLHLQDLLISSIGAYVCYIALARIYRLWFSPLAKSGIPGPASIVLMPLMSTLQSLMEGTGHIKIEEMLRKYDTRVLRNGTTVVCSDPVEVAKILRGEDWLKPSMYANLDLGDTPSLVSAIDRKYHKRLRRLCSPAFSLKMINSLEPYMRQVTTTMEDLLHKQIQGGEKSAVIDFARVIHGTALDIIAETAFGASLDMIHQDNHPMHAARTTALKAAGLQRMIGRTLTKMIPPVAKATRFLDDAAREMIDNRRAAQTKSEAEGKEWTRNDILQMLLTHIDPETNESLSDAEIQSATFIFSVAGSETTANTVIWTVVLLHQNPECKAKLVEELRLAYPDGLTQDCSAEVAKTLPYLNAVIKESLRLMPIIGLGVLREAPEGANLCGYSIPAKTPVLVPIWAMQRDESLWQRAKEFWPERWLLPDDLLDKEGIPAVNRAAYLPFSLGSRNCIGKDFAMLELRHILATLYRRWDVEVLPQDLTPASFITLQLKTNHMNVKFTPLET
jgi:cytochrome P450